MNRYEAYYPGATPTSIETTYEVYTHEVHAYDMHAHEIRTHEVTPIKYTLMSHMPMKVYSREMACPRDARLEAYAHETHAYEIHALRMLARKVLGDLRISHLTNGGAVLTRFELQNNDFPRQETKVSSGRTFSPRLHRTGPSVLTKRSLLAGLSFFKFGTVSLLPFPTSQMQQYEKLAPDNSRCRGSSR
jgi:hypothetical protein